LVEKVELSFTGVVLVRNIAPPNPAASATTTVPMPAR
jgi:hypothetical protein